MASFNKVIMMGNLTRDPELRVTPSGLSICKLGLAMNRSYTKQDGTKQEETTFVDVDGFGKQAELIAQYLKRGDPIFIEGRLRLDQWETNTGDRRSKLCVVLENFQFVGRSGDGSDTGSAAGRSYAEGEPQPRTGAPAPPPAPAAPPPPPAPAAPEAELDDDVPF